MSGASGLITHCLELEEAHIGEAITGRDTTRSLLERLAAISAPNTGVAKVLLVYARLATIACDWVDGDLTIDLVADDASASEGTIIETSTELGGGMRERLFAPMRFAAPLTEFQRAIARVPHMVAPLFMRSITARRIRLSATEIVRRTTVPPPPMVISAESLFVSPLVAVAKSATFSMAADDALVLPVVAPGVRPEPEVVQVVHALPASDPPVEDVDSGWDD